MGVEPSGGAAINFCVASAPPAPASGIGTIGVPSDCCNFSARIRFAMSTRPPAGNPAIRWMGRAGHFSAAACACVDGAPTPSANAIQQSNTRPRLGIDDSCRKRFSACRIEAAGPELLKAQAIGLGGLERDNIDDCRLPAVERASQRFFEAVAGLHALAEAPERLRDPCEV